LKIIAMQLLIKWNVKRMKFVEMEHSQILRWLIPLSRSSCLVLTCGFCATAAKMLIAFASSVAFLDRWRLLLSTLSVSWKCLIMFEKTDREGMTWLENLSAYKRTVSLVTRLTIAFKEKYEICNVYFMSKLCQIKI
jgi:hypothetical protein